MALLILPMLAFVAAHSENQAASSSDDAKNGAIERLRAVNGTSLVLECTPAQQFIRTHMAPDFENPQLVRRLDWFHDESLVASYQQDVVSDFSQQWWVAGTRYELRKPFYELRINPLIHQDSGTYKCRLETDPLFDDSLSQTTKSLSVIVLVKPLSPSKPVVSQHTDKSVDLQWAHSNAAAHRPILRYSILVSQVDDSQLRVLTTDDNRTHARVDGLKPNTQYVFSVRAENGIGESAFGPEALFRTIGQPPKWPPKIASIENGTSAGCVEVGWALDERSEETEAKIAAPLGFRIMVHRLGTAAMREWYVKGGTTRKQALCALDFFIDYILSLETDNGFGYSPSTTASFRTDQGVPDDPPQLIGTRAIIGSEAILITWREPSHPNGLIQYYQIYHKEVPSQHHPILTRLKVDPNDGSKSFAYNLTKLAPATAYKLRLSASTVKGEGVKSEPLIVTTDYAPPKAPTISNLSYSCNSGLLEVRWLPIMETVPANADFHFRVRVEATAKRKHLYNTTDHKLLVDQLVPDVRHTVLVSALVRSLVDNRTFIEGPASKPELFVVPKAGSGPPCYFQSSVCPSDAADPAQKDEHQRCEPIHAAQFGLSLSPGSNRDASPKHDALVFLLLGVAATVALSILFTWVIKRCTLFKLFLKSTEKGKSKCGGTKTSKINDLAEALSLVNDPLDAVYGQTVTVMHFDEYFEQMAAEENEGFRKQFQELEFDSATDEAIDRTSSESCTGGVDPSMEQMDERCFEENRLKNRYLNISAFEHSRIRLQYKGNASGDPTNDDGGYINANYIDSCDEKNAYIATQAPLPSTFEDFWTMVWQEKSNVLVVITNMVESGRRKCDQYWPEVLKAQITVGPFQLTLSAEMPNAVFVHRVIQMKLLRHLDGTNKPLPSERERLVHQLHFTSWPDHGVPRTPFPLLYFLNYVADIQSTGPCIVHCSAGVGRSGSFILIDSMRRHLLQCDRINVQAHLRHMRRQRSRLVQTLEQYVFCHTVLRHLIANGITRQPVPNFPNYLNFLFHQRVPQNGQRRVQAQFQSLCACPHHPNCQRPFGCVTLPGYHRSDEFFVCDWPVDSVRLWETIWENSCQTLILLLDEHSDEYATKQIPLPAELLPPMQNGNCMMGHLATVTVQMGNGAVPNCQVSPPLPRPADPIVRDEQLMAIARHKEHVLLRKNEDELCVRLIRVRTQTLEEDTWAEIERVHSEVLQYHRCQIMVLDMTLRHEDPMKQSPAPFVFCALQSLACQLEQERSVDVLLYLASYRELVCGCWTSQADIEFIYKRALELVELQKNASSC